jgi:hypothetical protein
MSIWTDRENCETNIKGDAEVLLEDGNGRLTDVSTVGFLVRTESERGVASYSLSNKPAHTNSSHEPKLDAWCGSWNNRSTFADGLARVARTAKNGRVCLARVPATARLLEELGYPELADDDMAADGEADRYGRWLTAMETAGVNLDALTDEAWRRAYAASVALLSD